MGKHQRTKGASGERELAGILAEHLGMAVKRNLGQARDSGHDITLPGFNLEVKRRARIGLVYEALEQAKASQNAQNQAAEASPVAMVRADGKEWLAVMPLKDWIRIAREEIAAADMARAA